MAHCIAILIFPDFQPFNAVGPVTAFEIASQCRGDRYMLHMVAVQAGLVRSSSGARWDAGTLPLASQIDTLLIVGSDGVDAVMADARTRRFVQCCAVHGVRVVSVCSSSLLLAVTGLLNGRCAATRRSRSERFAYAFPQVWFEPDHIHVNDGPIWTSVGIGAGIDLTLALIADDLGERLIRAVARQLVVYYHRPGGQSQFSALNEMDSVRGHPKSLLDHVRRNLGAPHRVGDLAEHACMSPRHFARVFQVETGPIPAEAVEKLYVEATRAALENGVISMQWVATECGFGDTERMCHSFQRLLDVPPSSLRTR